MEEEAAFFETTDYLYGNARHYGEGEGNVHVKFCLFSCVEMTSCY